MSKREMIEEILKNQNRANDYIFTKEKLEDINFEMLTIICEVSKSIIAK